MLKTHMNLGIDSDKMLDVLHGLVYYCNVISMDSWAKSVPYQKNLLKTLETCTRRIEEYLNSYNLLEMEKIVKSFESDKIEKGEDVIENFMKRTEDLIVVLDQGKASFKWMDAK